MRHFRGFNIWVPQTCSTRVSGTVWWFLKPFTPDESLLSPENDDVLYPSSRDRTSPAANGSDLLGRCFLEPTIGVCCITRLGPEINLPTDTVTLHYRCLATQAEHYASVSDIEKWIRDGPILSRPANPETTIPKAPVTYPIYATSTPRPDAPSDASLPDDIQNHFPIPSPTNNIDSLTTNHDMEAPLPPTELHDDNMPLPLSLRRSQRKRTRPDFLKPKFKGKVYLATNATHIPRKQRVPVVWEYPGKQRVSPTELKIRRLSAMTDKSLPRSPYATMFLKYRQLQRDRRNTRVGWMDLFEHHCDAMATTDVKDPYSVPMPASTLAPIYPHGPLNLNEDGTPITYTKSHVGQHAEHWIQADAEEMERLLTSGTIRPIWFRDIPDDKDATYVNPVCSEKVKDDGALKLRTRTTIGGDRIDYPYTTTAVTAELESTKILINGMISDDSNFSTVDLEDFYLGTSLPHPEYIRIPVKLIPKKVIDFYGLKQFIHKGGLYCIVLKTHYGLPQAGALSQQRLFDHLEKHGYHQLFHAPALFRNQDGSVRFALVVDDFAVVWSSSKSMQHFLSTLRKLYTVKVDFKGSKYLGINIDIDKKQRHVTLSMPGYIAKLLKRVRPHGVKGASTPSNYSPPNYKNANAQTATVDSSPLASPSQQHELQVVVGTLLYYARTVDPSILTAVHELGSVQAKPSINDIKKMERLLQYVSTHQQNGIRYHASNMQLQIQSDASYLSRTKARSVLGGLHYLGSTTEINGPIFCTSKLISCVVTSAAEAELGAAFQNAQKGAQFRNTLIELGYPQQPTPILVDNTVAEGLANNTVNAKRSKSMDVRFFWLRDRVKNGESTIQHLKGRWNISDFFTKSLPKEKFLQFTPYIVIHVDDKCKSTRHTVVMTKKF